MLRLFVLPRRLHTFRHRPRRPRHAVRYEEIRQFRLRKLQIDAREFRSNSLQINQN